jgi:multiple sugar transport system substrate-binding protein
MTRPVRWIAPLVLGLVFLARAAAQASLGVLYMAQAGYQPDQIAARAEAYRGERGRPVSVTFVEYEDMYAAIIKANSGAPAGFDVVLTDLIWIADFARRGLIDPVPPGIAAQVRGGIPSQIVSAFALHDRLWSHPFLANMQILYANRDLLERAGITDLPRSLEQVAAQAERVRDQGLLKYPLFDSWNRQEALVCEFTWLTGAFGGTLTAADGSVSVDSPPAVDALQFMVGLLARGLMNPYALRSDELFASEVFLNGDAVFTTNWTYLLARLRELPYAARGLTAVPIPGSARLGRPSVATVSGFQGLSVAASSAQKETAWDFVRFLASPDFAREHLSELPVWRSVWQEPATRERDPFLDVKLRQLGGVFNRPQYPDYRSLSAILQEALSESLAGRLDPGPALRSAQQRIQELR